MPSSVVMDEAGDATAIWNSVNSSSTYDVVVASQAAGGAWSSPVTLDAQLNPEPAVVAVDEAGNATALWVHLDSNNTAQVMTASAPVDGAWSTPVTLDSSTNIDAPAVAVDPAGDVTAVWLHLTASRTLSAVTASRPAGGAWSSPATLDTNADHDPSVAVDQAGDATATWLDAGPGGRDSLMTASRPTGGNWSSPAVLDSSASVTPAGLAMDQAGDATAVWVSYDDTSSTTGPGVVAAERLAGGGWSAPVTLDNSGFKPSVAVDQAGDATAVWSGNDPSTGKTTVMAASQPAGGRWSTPDQLDSSGSAPAVAIDQAGDATAVWVRQGFVASVMAATSGTGPTPPSISIATPADGAHFQVGDRVLADYSCSDAGGGVATCSGPVADGQPIDTASAGTKTFTVTATDQAGDKATLTHHYSVDPAGSGGSGPRVRIFAPANGEHLTQGERLRVQYACSDSGATITSCRGPVASGGLLDTSAVGEHSFTVSAGDSLGRRATATSHYTVDPALLLLSSATAVRMPDVRGLSIDDARTKIQQAGITPEVKTSYQPLRIPRKITRNGKRIEIRPYQVYSQSIAPKVRVVSSAAHPKAVKLSVYVPSGAISGNRSKGCKLHGLSKGLRGLDLDEALQLLNAGGCRSVNLNLHVADSSLAMPEVRGSRTSGRAHAVTVNVTTNPADYDLSLFVRQGRVDGGIVSVGDDGKLTVGQENIFGVQVFNRANQKVAGATVLVDGSGVGSDDYAAKTTDSGEAIVRVTPKHAGPVRILVEEKDSAGNGIFGFGQREAVGRTAKTLVTIGGEVFKRSGGTYAATGQHSAGDIVAGAAACSGLCAWWNGIVSWFESLGKRPPSGSSIQQQVANADKQGVQAAEWTCPDDSSHGSPSQIAAAPGGAVSFGAHNTASQGTAAVDGCANGDQVTAGTAAKDFGGQKGAYLGSGGLSQSGRGTVIRLIPGTGSFPKLDGSDVQKVITAGGGNLTELAAMAEVITAGGGNVISAGGGNIKDRVANVISAGGGNLNTIVVMAGVISAGGGNLTNDQIAQRVNRVITAGGGNVSAKQVGNVITAGGGNALSIVEIGAAVISAGGGNVTAQRIANVITAGGGNLTSASVIAQVISAGGGNLASVDAGQVSRVISAGGGNLSEIEAIGHVISAGGGNLSPSKIATAANLITGGGGNIITAGGGNFATAGANLTAGIGPNLIAVSPLISDKGVG